jgi:hypothetical protein
MGNYFRGFSTEKSLRKLMVQIFLTLKVNGGSEWSRLARNYCLAAGGK